MHLFQQALQVAVTHLTVLFTLGGFVFSSLFCGSDLQAIDGRPATNSWVTAGLLLIEYTVPRVFEQFADNDVVYSGHHSGVDVVRANQTLALIRNAVDVANFVPVIPSFSALVSSSVSSVNSALLSKKVSNKTVFDTGCPRCFASGSESNGHAMNENNTGLSISSQTLVFASQISAVQLPYFCINEPNTALVDTGRLQCAALDSKKMQRMAGCGTRSSQATMSSATPIVVLPLFPIPSSVTSLDATLFCLNKPNKALSDFGRPRCAVSGSKKKGKATGGNNARKGAARKTSGSSGRSSNSGGSSSGGSSGDSSGGSAPPPPPPPPPGRNGGVPTRRSSRLRNSNSPSPMYALTTPRPRRLKVKEVEPPPDPPSDPPPPPPSSEPDNHDPYDIGDPYDDPFPQWLQNIMIFIFCGFAASNMAPRAIRMIPQNLVSQVFGLKKYFLRLEDIVPNLLEHANDFFWLETTPAPIFAAYRTQLPPSWPSIDGDSNPFPVYTQPIKDGPLLRFSVTPDKIVQALVQAGLIERTRKPRLRLRKYLSRLIIAVVGLFAALLMLDIDWLANAVERVMEVNEVDSGVAVSNSESPSTPFWLAPGIEYECGKSILDETYLDTPEASPDTDNTVNTSNLSDLETRDEEATTFTASFGTTESASEGLNKEASAVYTLILLAACVLQLQESVGLEGEEPTAEGPLPLTQTGDSSVETIAIDQVDNAPDSCLDSILETTRLLQGDLIESGNPEKMLEAAIGSSSTVTDLSAPVVEGERTREASDKASTSHSTFTSELYSSIHDPVNESSSSSTTEPASDPRGPGIWSPPVTEINGHTFVVVEGARRQRRRHRKAKVPANQVETSQ